MPSRVSKVCQMASRTTSERWVQAWREGDGATPLPAFPISSRNCCLDSPVVGAWSGGVGSPVKEPLFLVEKQVSLKDRFALRPRYN